MGEARIQKRLVTIEVITRGEKPAELNEKVQYSIISAVHKAVASTLDLNYVTDQGNSRRHEFIGIDIREIK